MKASEDYGYGATLPQTWLLAHLRDEVTADLSRQITYPRDVPFLPNVCFDFVDSFSRSKLFRKNYIKRKRIPRYLCGSFCLPLSKTWWDVGLKACSRWTPHSESSKYREILKLTQEEWLCLSSPRRWAEEGEEQWWLLSDFVHLLDNFFPGSLPISDYLATKFRQADNEGFLNSEREAFNFQSIF